MSVIAQIPWWPGTNCFRESKYAFELAGASVRIPTIFQIFKGKVKLYDCDLLYLVGGFSMGDHIRSGQIAAIDLLYRLQDQLQIVVDRKIPILGNCNGLQIMARAGLINGKPGQPSILLDLNQIATFQHFLKTEVVFHDYPNSVWTKGLGGLVMKIPVAHAEGRVVELVKDGGHKIAATYGTYEGSDEYPISPNGSPTAGLGFEECMGMMPHTERALFDENGEKAGLLIYENGVKAVS